MIDATRREPPLPTKTDLGPPVSPTGVVTILQVVGTGVALPLPLDKKVLSVGSAEGEVDLVVSSPPPADPARRSEPWQRVSRRHATIERRMNRLWICDTRSKNGITFGGRVQAAGEIVAGQSVGLGTHEPVRLLALDPQLATLRARLGRVLGFDAHPALDAAIEEIARGRHLLLLGEAGCDQRDLAGWIHRASVRRRSGFVELPRAASDDETARALAATLGGTLYIDLPAVAATRSAEALAAALADGRVCVVAARAMDQVVHRLGARAPNRFAVIDLPALADRARDVPRLLDELLREHGTGRRVGELGDAWVQALAAAPWSTKREANHDALRAAVPRLLALLERRSISGAAQALGISHQALSQWLARLGLPRTIPAALAG